MARLKVEGHNNLVRDTVSNAVINSSTSEYKIYMAKYRARERPSHARGGAGSPSGARSIGPARSSESLGGAHGNPSGLHSSVRRPSLSPTTQPLPSRRSRAGNV